MSLHNGPQSKQFKRQLVNILELLTAKREFPSVDCIWPNVCSSVPQNYTSKVEVELKHFPILHFYYPEKKK